MARDLFDFHRFARRGRRDLRAGRAAGRIESESPARVAPICPHFGVCGGCAVQHWEAPHYRAWKRGLVVEALRQAGLDVSLAELIDAHGEGRRRAV